MSIKELKKKILEALTNQEMILNILDSDLLETMRNHPAFFSTL